MAWRRGGAVVAGSRALVAALVLAAFAPAFGQDVILVATVDRTTVRENESFNKLRRAAAGPSR
jgi:predicted peroxiredoxin